jgi:hypothetical protein
VDAPSPGVDVRLVVLVRKSAGCRRVMPAAVARSI